MASGPPPGTAGEGMDMATQNMFDTKVSCLSCNRVVHYTNCRTMSKGKGTWRCNTCSSKIGMLRRLYEEWPTAEFSSLSEDQQQVRLDG